MKKWTSTALGGAPLNGDDLLDIFNSEIWDVIQGILSRFDSDTEGIIVSGCVISGSGPYDMTAGIVYLNGEFMRMPAKTGFTLPQYIQHDNPVNDSRTFADTTTHTVAVTKSATIDSIVGGGQNINITSTTDPDDRRLNMCLKQELDTEAALRNTQNPDGLITKVLNIGDWNMDSTGGITLAHGLGADWQKIIQCSIIIRDDSDTLRSSLMHRLSGADASSGDFDIDSSNINLRRATGSWYDSAPYDATSYNRGFIVLTLLP